MTADGGLIYQLLGDKAQSAFVRDWAIGCGMENASQWKEVMQEALEASRRTAAPRTLRLVCLPHVHCASSISWMRGGVVASGLSSSSSLRSHSSLADRPRGNAS